MKTIITFFLLLATLVSFAQTIRRVNNNVGVAGLNVYATAQAAHDAATANDILIIEPSSVSAGPLTLTKPLKIYGSGYFLDVNIELKADQRSSKLDVVNFDTGSGGSAMYGVIAGVAIYGVSNIVIERCNTSEIIINNYNKAGIYASVSNIVITRNYINAIGQNPFPSYTISNVLINNNIIGYLRTSGDPYVQDWIVRNNTFTNSDNGVFLSNSVFDNNLLTGGVDAVAFTNVSSSYNVSAVAGTFTEGVGNQNNYDVTSDRVIPGPGISADETFQIKTGSPLKTAGSGGIEVGAFGGDTPYIISGIPAIPSIISMINSGVGSDTNPMQVTISVKSNN